MTAHRDWLVMVRDAGAPAARLDSDHYRREAARLAGLRLVPSPRYDVVYLHRPHTGEVETLKEPPAGPPANGKPCAAAGRDDRRRADSPSVATQLVKLAQALPQPFTAPQLIVAAWEADPERFGLKGYERLHPDSGKVFATLCGRRGAVARGLLTKLPGGLYLARATETEVSRA